MSHMVIYRSVEGKPGFQQTDDLVSAVEFVERLRNVEGVESARIYRLEQVNFRFQPYYQVHLDTEQSPTAPMPTVNSVEQPPAAEVPATPAESGFAPPNEFRASVDWMEQEREERNQVPLLAPAVNAEAAPLPPPPPTTVTPTVAEEASPEPAGEDEDPAGVPSPGPTMAPPEGVRRGLFNR